MLPSRNGKTRDRADAKDNPYAPPATLEATPPDDAASALVPYRRIAVLGQVVGALLGGFLGVMQTVQYGFGLSRFGGLAYVPRVVALSTVRALGSGAALLVMAVASAIVLHRAGRLLPALGIVIARDPRALWLAAGTAASFVVVCAVTLVASATTAAVLYSVRVSAFVAEGWDGVTRGDLGRGAALAAVDGALCTAIVPLAAGWLASPKRGLVLKVFVAYAAVQVTTVLEQTVLSLLDR